MLKPIIWTFVKKNIEVNVSLIEGNPRALLETKILEVFDFHENTDGKEHVKSSSNWWRNTHTLF